MTTRTNVLYACGALSSLCAVGCFLLLLFGGRLGVGLWIGVTVLSCGWIVAGVAFGPARWAVTAVPAAIAGLLALFYLKDHPFEPRGWVMVAIALVANVLHLYSVRRGA